MQLNPSLVEASPALPSYQLQATRLPTEASQRFLSVDAVATVLGMSNVTLYRAIHEGQFPAIKIRGRYVIPAKILDQMEDAAIASGALVNSADWAEGRGAA